MIETFIRSSTVDFPRPKIYLTNLNQLIQRKIIIQPEIQVSTKLFPQRTFAKKLSISHQRNKSSAQLRQQKFDLHWSHKKSSDIRVIADAVPGSQFTKTHDSNKMFKAKSTQLEINAKLPYDSKTQIHSTQTLFAQNLSLSPSLTNDQRQATQRNFLRKGSSLQKQIVINLLRHKMMKEQQEKQKKEYSNHEIIKMIQVFKGVVPQSPSKRSINTDQIKQSSNIRKLQRLKEIKGWQDDPLHDFEEHDQK